MRTRLESWLIAALMVGGSAAGLQGDGGNTVPKDMKGTPLIARSVLLGNPDRANALLSPDGTRVSYLADVEGLANVWVGPVDNPSAAKPVTKDETRGIRTYGWAFDNQHIWYLQDKKGDGNWHIHVMNLTTNETRDLTPVEGVREQFQQASHKFPKELLLAIDDRSPQLYDLYRVHIETGERTLIQKNDAYMKYTADADFKVRLASQVTAEGDARFFKRAKDGEEWTQFMEVSHGDAMLTGPVGFDKTGRILYLADSSERDTTALVAYNLETDKKSVIALNPRADLGPALLHPTDGTIQAASFTYERREWKILDDSIKADLDYLAKVVDGDLSVVDRTADDKHWLVAYLVDDGPVRFYHYDRRAKRAKFLFTNQKELEGLRLTKVHPVVIKSRDGMDLVSYVSLPAWVDADGDGRPKEPLPMVLAVHGGPWIRDVWGLNPMQQWLTNRGYAVLSVNFRGSAGFGKDFISAGNLEWGGKMHDDLIDAVHWAVKQKIADPKRVGIMGVAYGGYAALTGLTVTPDVFACGVDISGPSNLITLIQSIPPQLEPVIDTFVARVGDYRTEEGQALLTERSPLTYADRITKPLLIGQGGKDVRVRMEETTRIIEAMKAKGVAVTCALFEDEGHGFSRRQNNKAFFAVAEAFLAKHLGGRYEPVGKDFEGSSIAIPEGAGHVPGVAEALSKRGE